MKLDLRSDNVGFDDQFSECKVNQSKKRKSKIYKQIKTLCLLGFYWILLDFILKFDKKRPTTSGECWSAKRRQSRTVEEMEREKSEE